MESGLGSKVVVVTGCSGGIGSVIARKFAEERAFLVAQFRRNPAAVRKLEQSYPKRCLSVKADLANEHDVRELFARAIKRFGRVDTVVANAGAWESADVPLDRMSAKQWRTTMDNVLTTTFLTLREFLRIVRKQKSGNAVLIASTAAIFGEAGHADYASAKAAMAFGLTSSLKNEIARLAPPTSTYCGGRVNCICPGWTRIPRTAAKLENPNELRRMTATMALRKVAEPDDIANAAIFLSSDILAGHITGETITIAGGMEGRLLWPSE